MTRVKPIRMLRLPVYRKRWFGKRELCGIEGQGLNAPEPKTLVKSQKRLRPTMPREVPAFLLLGADESDEHTAKVTQFRREVKA